MIELFEKKKDCCGCGACENVCPQNAITMVNDEDTFYYPSINPTLCVNCKACTRVCPIANTVATKKPQNVYAATYQKREVLQQSSSGGIFPALASRILSEGGVVFATALKEGFVPAVIAIERPEELVQLQGSKYVQSHMGDCFQQIRKLLKKDPKVLFCGTPCQIAAVKQYVGGYDANLYLIDIVCHGVPSVQVFQDYIKHLEEQKDIHITSYTFRDKKYGQDNYFSYTYEKSGRQSYYCNRAAKSSYYKLFLNNALFRESCYHCKFATESRVGDISLCDYWGIEKEHPEFAAQVRDKKLCGISGIFVNTEKGQELFQQIHSKLLTTPSTFTNIAKHNPQLLRPSAPSSDREQIFSIYHADGYQAVDQYYFRKYKWNILKGDIGGILPLSIRKKINDLLRRNK